MPTKYFIALSVLVVTGNLLCETHSSQIFEQQKVPFPAGLSSHHFSKKLQKATTESEICIGRRCSALPQRKSPSSASYIGYVILSMIGLVIHFTVKHERVRDAASTSVRRAKRRTRDVTNGYKRTAHSTSIACSSLSPSPVPKGIRGNSAKKRAARSLNCSQIPWDRMAKSSDFEVCLSLNSSPLPSRKDNLSFSSASSSTSGMYACAPPRRWRGNTKLNLATSAEVVPHEVDLYYYL